MLARPAATLPRVDLRFKTNLLEHLKAIGVWAERRAARASVDAVDGSLLVRWEGRERRLLPQYVGKRDGVRLAYFDVADRCAQGFVGWLPYRAQAWDLSLSKPAFKAAARELGIPVPPGWTDAAAIDRPFLVKRARGAFGEGMRGPFPAHAAATLQLAEGEFAEGFVEGRIARAWYWGPRLAVLELFEMPSVCGDGVTPYETLLRRGGIEPPADFAPLAALQGVQPQTVLAAGRRVICDYRYVSPFNPTVYANANQLARLAGSAVEQRFADAGRRLWPRIPGPPGRQAGFVLDAIVDRQDQPWFLEMNSNPQGHPDWYAAMLDGLFGLAAP